MASFNILTLEGLKQKQRISASETFDFSSIKIGSSGLELKETSGAFDFSAVNITNVGLVDGRDVSVDGTAQDSHIANVANPHSVTKTQVGLANVTNDAQLKAANLDTDVALTANSITKIPSQSAVKAYVDAQVGGSGSFSDSAFRVKDNGDATKQMAFEVSAITTATTRTITMPDTAVNLGLIATAIQSSEKGANSGVATLDSGGKVPVSQLPNSVMEYKGNWSASANSPALANGTGNPGDVYKATTAGTVDFGAGNITFVVGDYVIYSGSVWELSHSGADAVISVNGQAGTVVLTTSDIAEGTNLYYTTARFDTRFSSKSTSDLTEGTNLYFTNARVIASTLTGYAALAGTVSSADTVLGALQKIDGNVALKLNLSGGTLTGTLTSQTIVPSAASTYNLGASGNNYSNVFANQVNTGTISKGLTGNLTIQTTGTANGIVINTISGDIKLNPSTLVVDVSSAKLSNVLDPASAQDAVTKNYGDTNYLNTASEGVKLSGTDIRRDDAITKTNDNAGAITVRQVAYIKANGNVDLARADVASLSDFQLAIVEDASIAAAGSGKVTVRYGAIVGGYSSLTPGKKQFVSRATAGALTESLTGFVAGESVYSVGRAISATQILIDPQFEFEF